MLLVMDVGNTNITLGVFCGEKLEVTFRMTTKIPRTSDEYGIIVTDLLRLNYVEVADIQAVVISSVVPNVMHSLTSAILKYIKVTPIIVAPGIRTGIRVATEDPRSTGADRIVDAVGAYELYGGPVIVIDYGTATTYDLVDADGAFVAGVTAPGIRTSAQALWKDAAKLPEIEIVKPKTILAQETISSMQAGIVFGQIGQTEYIVKHIKDEASYDHIKVVATGGLGKIIASETDCIDVYDPNLTLQGMRLIYEKQR